MPPAPKPRRHRRLLLGLLGLVAGVVVYAAIPSRATVTVGPETTVATGPLDEDGRVDYIAAVNERLRGDITPEQNANVLIWEAIGPRPEGPAVPAEFFQWLGRPAPPGDGEYLTRWDDFFKARLLAEADAEGEPEWGVADRKAKRERAQQWPWAPAAEPDVAAWLAANDRPLALLSRASTRPAYYNPLTPPRPPYGDGRLTSSRMPGPLALREAANLFVCRAMMRLGAGQPDAAWRDLMTCHRLGRLAEKGGTLIEYLVGVAVQYAAVRGELVFLGRANLTAAQVAACRADLQALPPPSRVADKIDVAERFYVLDGLQMLARAGAASVEDVAAFADDNRPPADSLQRRLFGRSVNWDPGLRYMNTAYDRCVAALRLGDEPARRQAMTALIDDVQAQTTAAARAAWASHLTGPARRGEDLSKLIVGLLVPVLNSIAGAEVRADQTHHNLAVAFALAAYRADHGMYPPALADLAPKYLPEVPPDIYANGALLYRPTAAGYLLYSVGPNKEDDEGHGREADPPGDDLAVEMPAKEPPPVKKPEIMPDDDPE